MPNPEYNIVPSCGSCASWNRCRGRRGFVSVGLLLTLIGIVIFLVGMGISINAVGGLYQSTAADPLNTQNLPMSDVTVTQRTMFTGFIVSACGLPFLFAGTILHNISKRRRKGL